MVREGNHLKYSHQFQATGYRSVRPKNFHGTKGDGSDFVPIRRLLHRDPILWGGGHEMKRRAGGNGKTRRPSSDWSKPMERFFVQTPLWPGTARTRPTAGRFIRRARAFNSWARSNKASSHTGFLRGRRHESYRAVWQGVADPIGRHVSSESKSGVSALFEKARSTGASHRHLPLGWRHAGQVRMVRSPWA